MEAEVGKLLEAAHELGRNYQAIEYEISSGKPQSSSKNDGSYNLFDKIQDHFKRVIRGFRRSKFKFDEILLDDYQKLFLTDPSKAMNKAVYNPLFNLLQGKVDLCTFEKEIRHIMPLTFRQLYQNGYEKWAILNLLKLMDIQAAFSTHCQLLTPRRVMKNREADIESHADPPTTIETKALNFKFKKEVHALCISDIVVRQKKTGNYTGIKLSIGAGISNIRNLSVVENLSYSPMGPGPQHRFHICIHTG